MNMKNLFLLLVCGLCFQSVGSFAQGCKIQVNIPQMSNKQVILANYFEGKVYAVDTAQINSNGTGYFQKNNKKLARGMYILLFSPSNYFDIMIGDNQNFSITILHSPFLLLIFQKKYLKIPPTGILKYKKKNTSFQRHIIGTILIFRTVL